MSSAKRASSSRGFQGPAHHCLCRSRACWAAALVGLDVRDLHEAPEIVHETLMCLLKTREDKARFKPEVTQRLLGKVA